MPNIIVPLENRRDVGEAIFKWQKDHRPSRPAVFVMPPEQETPDGIVFIGVPDGVLDHLTALGIPFERQ